jgi:hypothetical protein
MAGSINRADQLRTMSRMHRSAKGTPKKTASAPWSE